MDVTAGRILSCVVFAVSLLIGATIAISSPTNAQTMCPDGTYVSGETCVLAPDGTYVSGGRGYGWPQIAPDGSYVSGALGSQPVMTPEGGFVGGGRGSVMCPDGSYVSGWSCVLAPDGRYVGE